MQTRFYGQGNSLPAIIPVDKRSTLVVNVTKILLLLEGVHSLNKVSEMANAPETLKKK